MDEKRLAGIAKRVEKATIGPWIEDDGILRGNFEGVEILDYSCGVNQVGNVEFIVNARQDVPYLLAEIERLESVIWRISDYCDMSIEETEKFILAEDN